MAVTNPDVLTAVINGRTVALTGADAHPFKCAACDSCFRHHRFAARCHEVGSEDLRTRPVVFRAYDHEWELDQVEADNRYWKVESARYMYECSCGERWMSVAEAIECRHCLTYTDEGYCTEVLDIRYDKLVWTRWDGALTHEARQELEG